MNSTESFWRRAVPYVQTLIWIVVVTFFFNVVTDYFAPKSRQPELTDAQRQAIDACGVRLRDAPRNDQFYDAMVACMAESGAF